MLVYFGYTSCPDSCPTTLMVMAGVLKELGPEAAKVQPVFITVDPERDTPKILGEYTQTFDRRIIGLTGSKAEIDAASQAYGVFYKRNAGPDADNYIVDHSTYIYLMNQQGKFVRAFGADASSNTIASALLKIIAQSGDGDSQKQMSQMQR
jgi:protein SCO1/2